jgi:hypothetical protein
MGGSLNRALKVNVRERRKRKRNVIMMIIIPF